MKINTEYGYFAEYTILLVLTLFSLPCSLFIVFLLHDEPRDGFIKVILILFCSALFVAIPSIRFCYNRCNKKSTHFIIEEKYDLRISAFESKHTDKDLLIDIDSIIEITYVSTFPLRWLLVFASIFPRSTSIKFRSIGKEFVEYIGRPKYSELKTLCDKRGIKLVKII